jgi:CubicO group peptidase (beta-lactamase class C family)
MKLQNLVRIYLIGLVIFTPSTFNLSSSLNAASNDFEKPKSINERIARVENGLLPPVLVKGIALKKMNLADRMKHYKVPGVSVAVINNYAVEWAKGYGVKDISTNEPVTTHTLFQAASISKPVATMGVLRLVQEGKLSLDEDVNAKLKSWKVPENDFTKEKKVTLRGLVTHNAGLTVHGFRGYAATEPVPTLVQLLNGEKPANSARIVNDTAPGKIWRYSGGGFCVMQQLVVDVTGKSFPQLMQENVFSKIGMPDSTYEQPLPARLTAQAATGHRLKGDLVKGHWHTYPEMAAAGLWTTPTDLAKLAIEVQKARLGKSNKVLSKAMTEQMLTRQFENWGLGFNLEGKNAKDMFSHGGSNEGFRCHFVAFSNSGQGAIVMTNSDNGGALAQEIIRSIAAEYAWAEAFISERAIANVDAKVYESYVGEYASVMGKLAVTIENGGLYVTVREQARLEFYPESESRYFTPEVPNLFITFNRNETGKVISLTVQQGKDEVSAQKMK